MRITAYSSLGLAQLIWRALYRGVRSTGIINLRIGGLTMRQFSRGVVANFLWPLCVRFVRHPVAVDGSRMWLTPEPTSFSLLMGTYEAGLRRVFEQFIKSGMTVVDVGANIGIYTLLAARKTGSKGRVYAFEPEHANFELLEKNVELNEYSHVTTIPMALSDKHGQAQIYLSASGNGSHSMYRNDAVTDNTENIQCVSFDEFWEAEGRPTIHFIKMDIEGAEAAVLRGMDRFLHATDALTMVLEFYPGGLRAAGSPPDEFLANVSARGFRLQVIDGVEIRPFECVDVPALVDRLGSKYGVNVLCTRP